MSKPVGIGRLLAFLPAVALLFTACTAPTDKHWVEWEQLDGDSVSYESGYQSIAQADGLQLLLDESTGSVAVKTAGSTWYSNPESPENDPYASGTVQDRMRSQFMLYYYDENSELKTMNSYTDCVKNGQHRVEDIPGGVKIVYTLGSFVRGVEYIPQQLTDERFQELFGENSPLSQKDRRFVEKRYRQEDTVWVWRSTESSLIINQMLDLLDQVGYDEQQLQADNAAAGLESTTVVRNGFQIAVCYTLEDGGLRVTVPMEDFRYAGNVEPVRLELLEFFGAAENSVDGYMFVPDGCGALIPLATAASTERYTGPVYGTQNGADGTQTVRLPVYGMKNGTEAFVAMVEEGDALASIQAYQSGITCARSVVYCSFTIKESGYVTLSGQEEETEILSFQRSLYDGDLSVLFHFLHGDEANYVGMAKDYRQRLLDRQVLTQPLTENAYPLSVQTIGAVECAQSFLMIRYEGWEALTTFEQVGDLAHKLLDDGIADVRFEMNAWLTGGLRQTGADSASPLAVLGGTSGLKSLLRRTAELDGVRINGMVNVGLFSTSNLLTRYTHAARTVDQLATQMLQPDVVTKKADPEKNDFYYVLASNRLQTMAKAVAARNFADGLMLTVADLADVLYGDYTRGKTVDRQQAAHNASQAMKTLAENGKLSVTGGNAYALSYADTVNDVSLSSSGFAMLAQDVPFYSLVLHGYVRLYPEALNYQADRKAALLEAVASGTGLSCCWMAADSAVLKDTDYSAYFSAGYADSYDTMLTDYRWAYALVGDLQCQTITDHRLLQEGVTVTVYDNGYRVYVNRGDRAVTVDGIVIPAADAVRVDGKGAA